MSETIYTGAILVLALVQLIESIAVGLPISYFPSYVTTLGASIASIGLFTSSFALANALMSPRMGRLSDQYGRKKLMMVGIFFDIIFGVIQGIAPSWIWLLIVRIINGAVAGAAMISVEAFVIDSVDPTRRGEASGFIMSMRMVGHQLGPMFGGVIQYAAITMGFSTLMSYRIPYFIDSVLALVALLLVMWKLEEPSADAPGRRGMFGMGGTDGKLEFSFSFRVMLLSAFVMGIGLGFAMPIMVLFYSDKFGLQPIGIGTIISISGVIGLFVSWFSGRLSDRFGRKVLIAIGETITRVSGFFLPLTATTTQATYLVGLRSIGSNISMPSLRALRADIVPAENRGRYFGFFGTAFTSGMIVGPLVGTWLYENFRFTTFNIGPFTLPGYGIPFFLNVFLGIISTLMLLIWVKEPEVKSTQMLSGHGHSH